MNDTPNPLSPRERDVLRSFERGLSTKDISEEWGLHKGTVSAHIRLIHAKLGVKTVPQAVAVAVRKGWI